MMSRSPVNILAFAPYYLPSYKSGGPVKTVAGMVEHLGDEFAFRIVCGDRDFGDSEPFAHITHGAWQSAGKAEVRYISRKHRPLTVIRRIMMSTPYDIVYLNSFFSPVFTVCPLVLMRFGFVERRPVVVAPRGEFSMGALGLKSRKKRLFIDIARWLGLYKDVSWHASSDMEVKDIRGAMGISDSDGATCFHVAPDLCPTPVGQPGTSSCAKERGRVKLVFLSRIAPMKNLDYALRVLSDIGCPVSFDIYGPVDRDLQYWEECQRAISSMPENIRVSYRGPVESSRVSEVLRGYHFLLLPTRGENFGHVILEALSAGLPVIISDRTPWRGLQPVGAGWDLSLDEPGSFQSVLRHCVDMDSQEFLRLSQCAKQYASRWLRDPAVLDQNRKVFTGHCGDR